MSLISGGGVSHGSFLHVSYSRGRERERRCEEKDKWGQLGCGLLYMLLLLKVLKNYSLALALGFGGNMWLSFIFKPRFATLKKENVL